MLHCKFCSKELKNKNALSNHQIRCKENPNKIKICNNLKPWSKGKTYEDFISLYEKVSE